MKFNLNILQTIKDKLVRDKDKIHKNLSSLKLQDPFTDPDRLIDNAASDTEANEESSHERMEALEKELKTRMLEIEHSLKRISKGTYGKCIRCKKIIDFSRLKINPTALYCVSCERIREK